MMITAHLTPEGTYLTYDTMEVVKKLTPFVRAGRALLAQHPYEALGFNRTVWRKFERSAAGWQCVICELRRSHESWCPVPLMQEALENEPLVGQVSMKGRIK